MILEKLSNRDIRECLDLYVAEKHNFSWFITFDEFVKDYISQCDVCHKMVFTDCELPTKILNNGETCYCCEECYKEFNVDYGVEDDCDPYYDYYEEKLIKENI